MGPGQLIAVKARGRYSTSAGHLANSVTNLSTLIQKEVGLLWGVDKEMNKLSSTLSTIMAVLDDAEMKQHQDKSILNWLRKLKDAAYKVGDILDECETETLKWEIKHQNSGPLKKVWTSAITHPVVNLSFRHKIGNRMKDLIEDINAIAEERKLFHLNEGLIGKGLAHVDDSRETSSALPPLDVFGREDDKEKIVKVLTKEVLDIEGFSVYPILGMGGLGKTTLAQMVFNDDRIVSHFELRIWVYVSENFNVKQVMKQIIESTPGGNTHASSLDNLQKEVISRLSGKRILLVLDDAWSEDQEEWDKLKPVLACGSPGACVVVTTRGEKVASIIRTLPTHYLLPLSEDDCWSIFRQRAFGHGNDERHDLVDIGKEIVKKCGGVPLAAKALGGLMRFKREKKEWISVKESDIWNIPPQECSILPALRLSYYNLPLELRHCFSYCALFLKGSEIGRDKLIHLWMANGFISSKNNMEVEDVGSQIWNELYARSFFQDKEKHWRDGITFKMHDLMHDLAKFVMGDECQIIEAQRTSSVPNQRIRYAALIHDSNNRSEMPEALKKQRSLQTILFQRRDPSYTLFECSWDFKTMGSLRVLDVSEPGMRNFPGSVGDSKHLRYLNLSGTNITELPASICELPNLQTLNLNYCSELRTLPKKLNKLRGLRHLCLLDCFTLKDTPAQIGKLTQLKTLSLFVVGEKNGHRLGELQHLSLRGELEIQHLERVKDPSEAKEANLAGKPDLRIVRLSWDEISSEHLVEKQEQVIEALEPHPNVEELYINNYGGKELPIWMENPLILKNLVRIELSGCTNCLALPVLWKLPLLKRLSIYGMEKMEYMTRSSSSSYTDGGFESLERLEICDLPNLKELPIWMGNPLFLKNVVKIYIDGCTNCLVLPAFWQLPRLKKLTISGMEKMEYMMIQNGNNSLVTGMDTAGEGRLDGDTKDNVTSSVIEGFPSLELLEIYENPNLKGLLVPMDQQKLLVLPRLKMLYDNGCPQLTLPILPALESLGVKDIINVNVLNQISKLTSLTSLSLEGNEDLVCLPDDMFQNLTRLQELSMWSFKKLKTLPRNMSGLVALTKFRISHFDELECLPDGGIASLVSLLEMILSGCPKIVCLPDSIQTLTRLHFLAVGNCSPDLDSRCEYGSGEDWHKIAHIDTVLVNGRYPEVHPQV